MSTISRRGTGTKKPKKIPLPRTPKMVDVKWYGPEPELEGIQLHDNDTRLIVAYNWYNYFYTVTEAKKWALEYYAKASPETAKILSKVPESEFSHVVGWMSRLLMRDAILPDQSMRTMTRKVQEMISLVQAKKEEEEVKAIAAGPRYKAPAWETMIADIEDLIDQFAANGYEGTIDVYSMLQQGDHPKTWARGIADYYRPLFDELKLLLTKKDKDLNEGYRKLTKKQMDNYLKVVHSIVDDAERWYSNKAKIVRTKRAPKKKSSEQILKNFKYSKEHSALKLVSIDPAAILTATTLVAYNHKYKRLIIFTAKEGETLSVKGTSIVNVDESKLTAKTLRKPEQQLPTFLSGAITHMKKRYEEIKTKPSVPSTRISEDVVLLKAYK